MLWGRRNRLAGVAAAALAAFGCREELGPEPMLTTQVAGKVHFRAQPVGGGWIEFYPIDGSRGYLRSAPLRPDGTFVADGVGVGLQAIKLVNTRPPIGALLPGGADFERVALIRRYVDRGSPAQLDIDLLDEYVRYFRARTPG